ncbi:MAG: hypothetical protein ABFD57_06880 [Smithella sp.]|nr:hypothetical protein [Syntrophaceae bacterium]
MWGMIPLFVIPKKTEKERQNILANNINDLRWLKTLFGLACRLLKGILKVNRGAGAAERPAFTVDAD